MSGANLKKSEPSSPLKSSGQPVIRYDRYRLSLKELLVAVLKGTSAAVLVGYTFYRSIVITGCLLPLGILYPFYEREVLKKKRKKELASQFKEGMMVLASSFGAGYSIENALSAGTRELMLLYGEQGLITREFSYMIQQIRTNRPVEQLLEDLANRSGLEDIRNFAEVFCVAKRSGGDLSAIMRHTADVIRDKMQVKEEIATLTASRQFEQKIMNLIPFFIVFYVEHSSPRFFDQMYETGLGRILMTGCLITYLIAFVLARKILDIEV
ncbi:MAG: type II secretion system F family protein [Lachnospiraceae bacterium]